MVLLSFFVLFFKSRFQIDVPTLNSELSLKISDFFFGLEIQILQKLEACLSHVLSSKNKDTSFQLAAILGEK